MLTEETLKRLGERQEGLAVLFLDQSNPEDWKDLSTSTRRGDVYWMKKNASQTMGLIVRIQSLLNMHRPDFTPPIDPESDSRDVEALARQAEADADAFVKRISQKQPAR